MLKVTILTMNWVESITVLAAPSVASGENKLEKEENANELGEKFQFLKFHNNASLKSL